MDFLRGAKEGALDAAAKGEDAAALAANGGKRGPGGLQRIQLANRVRKLGIKGKGMWLSVHRNRLLRDSHHCHYLPDQLPALNYLDSATIRQATNFNGL